MKIRIPRISISTLFVIIPVLYFNSCTMEFIKHHAFVLPTVLAFAVMWLFVAFEERRLTKSVGIKSLLPMGIYTCILFILTIIWAQKKILVLNINFSNLLFMLFLMCIFIAYSDAESKNNRKFILSIWTLDTVVSCTYSIYRLIDSPNLSRYLSTGSFHQTAEAASSRGIIAFSGVNAIVLILLVLFYLFINEQQERLKRGFVIVIFTVMVFEAQFSIAIILLISGIISVFATKGISKKGFSTRVIAVALVGIILIMLLPNILGVISDSGLFGNEVNARINEILKFIGGKQMNDTDMQTRVLLYQMSVSAFFSSYGIGTLWFGSVESGGHSEFLDGFANYGIIYIVFIVGLICFYKYVLNTLKSQKAKRIYKIVFGIYIIMSVLNTATWAPMMLALFVIAPFICLNELGDQNVNMESPVSIQ